MNSKFSFLHLKKYVYCLPSVTMAIRFGMYWLSMISKETLFIPRIHVIFTALTRLINAKRPTQFSRVKAIVSKTGSIN
jgi:hypothetical protein